MTSQSIAKRNKETENFINEWQKKEKVCGMFVFPIVNILPHILKIFFKLHLTFSIGNI